MTTVTSFNSGGTSKENEEETLRAFDNLSYATTVMIDKKLSDRLPTSQNEYCTINEVLASAEPVAELSDQHSAQWVTFEYGRHDCQWAHRLFETLNPETWVVN